MSEKIPHASVLFPFSYFLFIIKIYPKMAGNEGTADAQDPELQEALRLSMEVDSTGIQSNSTTEVGGTQSRSTVSADEFAKNVCVLSCDCYAAPFVSCRLPGTDAHRSVWNEISTESAILGKIRL